MARIAERVHEMRKELRRTRALLRLLEGTVGRKQRRRENRRLRAHGRRLSPSRDARVHAMLLRGRKVYRSEAARLAARFEARAGSAERGSGTELRKAGRDLARARRLLGRGSSDHKAVARGLERLEHRARKAFREAARGTDPDALHAARKRAKDLRYALERAQPETKALARRLHRFSDALGEAHDRRTLADALLDERDAPPRLIKKFLNEAASRERAALRLGHHLFR